MIRKKVSAALLALAVFLMPAIASAHVVVKPGDVNVASFNTFNVGVPNEKGVAVTSVKLLIPDTLNYVSPTVKPGWNIDVEKTGEGESAKVTSITWSGGAIAAGFRDDFTFGAQAPAKAGEISWKAYQTYEDGFVAAWDQAPAGDEKKYEEGKGPYSVTKVVDDLKAKPVATTSQESSSSSNTPALLLAGVALLVSLSSFLYRKKA